MILSENVPTNPWARCRRPPRHRRRGAGWRAEDDRVRAAPPRRPPPDTPPARPPPTPAPAPPPPPVLRVDVSPRPPTAAPNLPHPGRHPAGGGTAPHASA